MAAWVDCDGVELGFVVNLKTLREVLKELSINGRRWWIASDPNDAVTTGYLSIGHGDPQCEHRLNTVYFRFPIVDNVPPKASTDNLVLLIDPSTCSPEAPGFYIEDGRMVQDWLADFLCFYQPLKCGLIARLKREI